MKIKTILRQHRRDFTAILECESCGEFSKPVTGYDDAYFHSNVIPNLECTKCGKKAPAEYRPLTTQYKDGVQV